MQCLCHRYCFCFDLHLTTAIICTFTHCLHQPKAEGDYVFAPVRVSVRPCVRPSVRASVLQVCYQLISATVGPIAAKLSTHTPWMPIQNLCPTFFKSASWWRYNRPICVAWLLPANLRRRWPDRCQTEHTHSLDANSQPLPHIFQISLMVAL